jgi:putative ABC transport system ATP-binding protein
MTAMETDLSRLVNVTRIYSRSGVETVALSGVTFKANPSELVLLLGPSGSGKTTMLTILAGLQKPTRGEVYLFGRNLEEFSPRELQQIRASHIGFIFQTFCLLDSLNVMDNILLVMKFAGISKDVATKRAIEFLDRLEIRHLMHAYPETLSQGEKQRVAVARALANGAELIIADEPTGSLATQQGMMIVNFLHDSCRTEGRSVLIASHDERISKYADRVLYLHDGVLEEAN